MKPVWNFTEVDYWVNVPKFASFQIWTHFLITTLLVTCYCFQLLCLVTPVFVLKQQNLDPVIMLYTLMCKQQKRVGEFFCFL